MAHSRISSARPPRRRRRRRWSVEDRSSRKHRKPLGCAALSILTLGLSLLLVVAAVTMMMMMMSSSWSWKSPAALLALAHLRPGAVATHVDSTWHAPAQTDLNNLTKVLDGDGVYGFIYDSSKTPDGDYGAYNWCNMPHVRRTEYVKPSDEFELQYVELIHRHHVRTPYADNSFPVEPYTWDCDDQGLFYFGQPLQGGHDAARAYWKGFSSDVNPFVPSGWTGTCKFPQITSQGLDDSWQHGADLYGVYHDLLGLLPDRGEDYGDTVKYRVTNNEITSQVAGMVINGMWDTTDLSPLLVQAENIDSLEPQYTCSAGSDLMDAIQSSSNPEWQKHLDAAQDLYDTLDGISGVPADDSGFHKSFDHYYDNLAERQCHAKPLPCRLEDGANTTTCVTQVLTDTVYRLGHWEYSQIYRDNSSSLPASAATFGVWVGELSTHLREVVDGRSDVVYFHNVAHDGSVSRLLSILQLDEMVWPGMGAEVVFELYKKKGNGTATTTPPSPTSTATRRASDGAPATSESGYYVRALYGGQVLKSSSPTLGRVDMIPVETLLAYFDALVGRGASDVKGKCAGDIPLEG